jgi:hypothetical protein
MDESAEEVSPMEPRSFGSPRFRGVCVEWLRWPLAERPVRSMPVVVVAELAEHFLKVLSVDDQHPVEALPTDGAHKALGKRVGTRSTDRGADDADHLGAEDLIEGDRELGVPVPNQELHRSSTLGELVGEVPGLLDNPGSGRVFRDAGDVHLPGVDLDEEQDVELLSRTVSTVKKSQANIVVAWDFRNSPQVGPRLSGVGSRPWRWRIFQTLEAARLMPTTESSLWIRR